MGPSDMTVNDWTRRQFGSANLGLPDGDPLEYWPMMAIEAEVVVSDPLPGVINAPLPRMSCLIAAVLGLVDLPL